jgi:hypothetical protein
MFATPVDTQGPNYVRGVDGEMPPNLSHSSKHFPMQHVQPGVPTIDRGTDYCTGFGTVHMVAVMHLAAAGRHKDACRDG